MTRDRIAARGQLFRVSLVQHGRAQVQQRPGEVALSDHDHQVIYPGLAWRGSTMTARQRR
jgi:hypothetical protein